MGIAKIDLDELSAAMRSQGIVSYGELSRKMGRSSNYVSRVVNGHIDVSVRVRVQLARALPSASLDKIIRLA